ncbi:hypothetical protein LEP1GSC133_2049 [Leptospira borgpetersenii serovar Pomona str. 200901868]|uniref:Uncharacterized protein n=1 Tax=Leptospira borgpetersenii serovar Pomona str. 200901868 TaxID=1192866 RepID=M6W9B5_LEPBO|nr:hypothetical protein LEP1GSC137_1805 [Leptospira borgpetersenii str. Noumea 25]EMO61824.1 hypothetical protein LEP1GSC133_2049 [Leptospira borgpetersenii serovar Pomona str. 200901868]
MENRLLLCNGRIEKNVKSQSIYRDKPLSDHAPLELEIKL